MKVLLFTIVVLVVSGFAAAKYASYSSDPACSLLQGKSRIDVIPLIDAPHCVRGKVEVQGKVNALLNEKKALMLIDLSEEDNCEDGCPVKRLPVSWSGEMPEKGTSILVSGELKKQDDKFLFSAQTIKLLPEKSVQ